MSEPDPAVVLGLSEAEWLACANPVRLLKRLRDGSARRYSLLACAYAVDVPHVNLRGLGREIVETVCGIALAAPEAEWPDIEVYRQLIAAFAEQWTGGPLLAAGGLGRGVLNRIGPGGRVVDEVVRLALRDSPGGRDANAVSAAVEAHVRRQTHRDTRDELNRLCRRPPACGPRAAVLRKLPAADRDELARVSWPADATRVPGRVLRRAQCGATKARLTEVRRAMADLVRELFGNPFRRPAIDPAWLLWNHGAVRQVAEQITASGTFTDTPILADALEDAGCRDAELLRHLRHAPTHAPGCWALEAVLGRG